MTDNKRKQDAIETKQTEQQENKQETTEYVFKKLRYLIEKRFSEYAEYKRHKAQQESNEDKFARYAQRFLAVFVVLSIFCFFSFDYESKTTKLIIGLSGILLMSIIFILTVKYLVFPDLKKIYYQLLKKSDDEYEARDRQEEEDNDQSN